MPVTKVEKANIVVFLAYTYQIWPTFTTREDRGGKPYITWCYEDLDEEKLNAYWTPNTVREILDLARKVQQNTNDAKFEAPHDKMPWVNR